MTQDLAKSLIYLRRERQEKREVHETARDGKGQSRTGRWRDLRLRTPFASPSPEGQQVYVADSVAKLVSISSCTDYKTLTAQVNEALCKVLCHNLCVVIQSQHELGIDIDFSEANAACALLTAPLKADISFVNFTGHIISNDITWAMILTDNVF